MWGSLRVGEGVRVAKSHRMLMRARKQDRVDLAPRSWGVGDWACGDYVVIAQVAHAEMHGKDAQQARLD